MQKYSIYFLTFVALSATAETTSNFIDQALSPIRDQKQITFVGTRSGEGYFSTDGKKMIYQSEREEGNPFYQMYLLDLKSGKSTRISTGRGMTTCGWIHPDLKKVMWSSTHLDKTFNDKVKAEYDERMKPVKKRYSWSFDDQYEIFASDLTGHNIRQLTNEPGYDAEGSYSPNGQFIAFASNRSLYKDSFSVEEKKLIASDASYGMEIYLMKSDGTGVKRLTKTPGYDGGPFFSADGKKITWRRFTPDGSRAEIHTMNIDGSDQKKLTQLNALSWAPFFHPSGKYIIFASSVIGYANFELFIVDSEGLGKPVRVTTSDGFDGLPTFSPDGKTISWTHRNEKGESQIYTGSWDHNEAMKLLHNAWPPDRGIQLHFSNELQEHDAQKLISYLASDIFAGRMTGSNEEKVYTREIARLFKSWGLVPAIGNDFIQSFEFTSMVTATENNSFEMNGRFEAKPKRGEDYQVLSYSKSGQFASAPVVFAGYGIKAPATDKLPVFDSYQNLDVKSKWVVLLDHVPNHPVKEMRQHLMAYSRPQHKITVAKNNNASGVIFVTNTGLKVLNFEGSLSETSLPVIKISTQLFGKLLEKSDSGYRNYSKLEADYASLKVQNGFYFNSQYASAKIDLIHNKSVGQNVIAKLPAGSKRAKGILIGAHGDHLGRGESSGSSLAKPEEKNNIHFGADDNASGVSGVLLLAHSFSKPKARARLKKPIYFGVWSGEEIGVLGSAHFTKEWKSVSKTDFKNSFEAAINMDMIGRLRDKLQVQGVGSAKEWSGLSEEVGLISGVPLVQTTDPYLPTDAMSFYLSEIPSISFFTGTHEDYHTPRDTAEKISYPGLMKVIRIVKAYTERLAQVSSEVVKYVKVEGQSGQKLEGRSFRIYLGTIPDYAQEGIKGVRISGASKNSPAEKAGIQAGDIITEFDRSTIENLYDYVYALQSAKPNQPIKLNVLRQGKNLELEIVPLLKE